MVWDRLQAAGYGVQGTLVTWRSGLDDAASRVAGRAFFFRSNRLIALRRPGTWPAQRLEVGVSTRSCYTCEEWILRGPVERFTHSHNTTQHQRWSRTNDFDSLSAFGGVNVFDGINGLDCALISPASWLKGAQLEMTFWR